MTFCPFIKWPLTDITGDLLSHQYYGRCQDLELKVMECLEAYGMDRGLRQCDALIKDFKECASRQKQTSRMNAMRFERNRQYWTGERSKEELYSPSPKLDSF